MVELAGRGKSKDYGYFLLLFGEVVEACWTVLWEVGFKPVSLITELGR